MEPILVKIGVKWPRKNVNLKNFPTDLDQIKSIDVKSM